MNGGVNGMMEESTELSHTDSLKRSPEEEASQEVDPLLSKVNCNSPDESNHVVESLEESNNIAEVTISNGIVDHAPDEYIIDTKVPEENLNDPTDNHCEPSINEVSIDSIDSQSKSDTKQELIDESDPLRNCSNDSSKNDENVLADNGVSEESESSQDNSQDEECSEVSAQQKAEEAVSINSESDMENPSQENLKEDTLTMLKEWSDGSERNEDCSSPEIQEIVTDNEDCVIEEEPEPKPVEESKPPLRRSSRAIKRKRYDDDMENGDDESDIEEVVAHDSKRRSKPIYVNNAKALVQMAAKQMRTGFPKRHNTVLILDPNCESPNRQQMRKNSMLMNNTSMTAQNLYQSILARGTTVTPVNNKNPVHTQSSCNSQPSILPSLTDDMFVVEAPSFIVPYVYEKPSVKPFREFVDELGNELEAQKAKEEEQKEKEKTVKETSDTQKKDTDGENKEDDNNAKINKTEEIEQEDVKKKKEARKESRRRKRDDDDASWDGESSSDSDDDIVSDEEDSIVIKEKVDSIEEIKDVTDLTVEKIVTGKSDNYFDMSLGKFFMDIGLNFVQEFVQNDLLKQQNRKLYREKKGGHSTKNTETSIASLMKNLEISKENNAPYRSQQRKCEFCSFKSESILVLSHHMETPHMKNNVYKCNFCEFDSKSPHDILYHMEAEHNSRGRLERAPAYHQCANCPFEDNGKGKLARHLIACAKKFKPEFNLSPPIEWEPPAKIPKMARARSQLIYQTPFQRGHVGNNLGRPVMNNFGGACSVYRPRGRSPMGVPTRLTPVQGIPIIRGGMVARHNNPAHVQMHSNFTANNEKNTGSKSMYQPSISITPLPRQPQPVQQPPQPHPPTQQNKSTCVICEICDGYIKDLEQLRNHMQWIHKVKIHPKMIYNRPPLNCQKCQFRFFTDQGLERHLLGSHGLVTSSMQEAANKGKDAGRCPVCGRVYQWKLLNHVTRDHKLTLKPAHLSYKCTVCTATFGMYKQFENHVYSAHSVVAKRVMDKGKTAPPAKTGQSLLKPLRINDEITIIPQPAKSDTAVAKDK